MRYERNQLAVRCVGGSLTGIELIYHGAGAGAGAGEDCFRK